MIIYYLIVVIINDATLFPPAGLDCEGNFMKGVSCSAAAHATITYKLFEFLSVGSFFGKLAISFLFPAVLLISLVFEIGQYLSKREK